jgi:hypothetical protein
MEDKKIKYDLSYFMLDGGKGHKTRTQYPKSRDFGLSKGTGTGKQKNTSRSFGGSPENVDPNGQDFQNELRKHQSKVQDWGNWGNLNNNRSRPGAIPWNSENNPERITPLGKGEKLSRRRRKK